MAERKTIANLKPPTDLRRSALVPVQVLNGDVARTERHSLGAITDFVNEPVAGLVEDAAASKAAAGVSAGAALAQAAIAAQRKAEAEAAAALAASEVGAASVVAGAALTAAQLAAAAVEAGKVIRGTLAELQAVTPANGTAGEVLGGIGKGDYLREGGVWVLKRPKAEPFRLYTSDLPDFVQIDGDGRAISEPVQEGRLAAELGSRAPFRLYTTDLPEVMTLDAEGRAISEPLQQNALDSRRPFRLYTSDLPEFVQIDADGRALSEPLQPDVLEARKPFRLHTTDLADFVTLDAEGRALSEAVQAETLTAEFRSRATFALFTTDLPELVTLDAVGRTVAEPAQQADFTARRMFELFTTDLPERVTIDAVGREIPGSASSSTVAAQPRTYQWWEGANYETSLSRWMDSTAIHMFLATGQSYNNGAVAAGQAFNTTPRYPGEALMLSAGVKPEGAASSGFADLVAPNLDSATEPYMVEMIYTMVAQNRARFGTSIPLVGGVAARGGWHYRRLKFGSTIFAEGERMLCEFAEIARRIGLRPAVPGIAFGEGEADLSEQDAFQAIRSILQWADNWERKIEAICPEQDIPVRFAFYAANRGFPSGAVRSAPWQIATRDLAAKFPQRFAHVGGSFAVETDESAHPTILGNRELGTFFGRGLGSLVYETGRRPCDIEEIYWTGPNTAQGRVYVPDDGNLVRDESGVYAGYPLDPLAPNYIGPGSSPSDHTARDGGIYVADKDGGFGVVTSVPTGKLIDFTFSREGHRGSTRLMVAPRPQGGITSGTNADMARTIFRGDVPITVFGSARPQYDFLIPGEHRL